MNYVIIYAQKRTQSYACIHELCDNLRPKKGPVLCLYTWIMWLFTPKKGPSPMPVYMNYVIIYAQKRAQSYACIHKLCNYLRPKTGPVLCVVSPCQSVQVCMHALFSKSKVIRIRGYMHFEQSGFQDSNYRAITTSKYDQWMPQSYNSPLQLEKLLSKCRQVKPNESKPLLIVRSKNIFSHFLTKSDMLWVLLLSTHPFTIFGSNILFF